MTEYTRDGGVIPSGMPMSERTGQWEHSQKFALYKALVLETIFPEDKRNTGSERIEYKVKINGQIYLGAVDMRRSGGVFDFSERTRKKVEKSRTGKVDGSTFDDNLDGEIVYVLFLNGHGDLPVIIGAADHPQRKSEKTEADANFDTDVFNGVEVSVDKDSNFKIQQVGRKDKDGTVLNPEAAEGSTGNGTRIVMNGINGSIEMVTSEGNLFVIDNTSGSESISIVHKQGSAIQMDKDGSIKIVAKGGSFFFLNAVTGEVSITSEKSHSFGMNEEGITLATASGKDTILVKEDIVQITSGKDVVVSAEHVTIDSGQVDIGSDDDKAVLAGKLAILFDSHIHATTLGPSGPPLPPSTFAIADATPLTAVSANNVNLKGNL